jgi:hypothetical protein
MVYQISTNSLDILCSLCKDTIFRAIAEASWRFVLVVNDISVVTHFICLWHTTLILTRFDPSPLYLSYVKLHLDLRIDQKRV